MSNIIGDVECKDCKYFRESEVTNKFFCTLDENNEREIFKDDYCSYGTRRSDEYEC